MLLYIDCIKTHSGYIIFSGMDTHLVVRPLLEKFDEKSHASGLRKIHFPHVSTEMAEMTLVSELLQIISIALILNSEFNGIFLLTMNMCFLLL